MSKNLFFLLLLFLLIAPSITGIFPANDTIGSDVAPSREAHYEFSGFENKISGFAAMEYGFSFQDENTTCTFDSYFPVDRLVNLKDGSLYLNRDLTFDELLEMTYASSIYCSDYFITFPKRDKNLEITIPTLGKMTKLDNTTLSSSSYALKWSYDDKYLAVPDGYTTLKIFYFDENTITLTASATVSSGLYDVDWRPNSYQIATAGATSPYLSIYEFNVSNGTITQLTTQNAGAQLRTCRWRPDGNYLNVLRMTSNELYIYSFDGSTLTLVTSIDIAGGTRYSYLGEASWRPDGKYLATGYYASSSDPEIYVHSFDGSNLALSDSAEVASYVIGIDWNPTTSLIAIGLYNTTENVRIYEHNADTDTITELTNARIGTNRRIRNTYWSHDGKYLAIAYWNGTTAQDDYEIYFYDKDAQTLTLITGFIEGSGTGLLVNWPKTSNDYIGTVGSNRNFQISEFLVSPFFVEDGNIELNSDINLRTGMIFSGICKINGNNNKLKLDTGGELSLTESSQLTLKNITITGIESDKIKNLSESATIIFDNVTLMQNDDTYIETGNFEIYNNLIISGNYTFSYKSGQQSTINENASLIIKDEASFCYCPNSNETELINLSERSSTINLDNASLYSTTTGICLKNGTLKINGKCKIYSDATTNAEAINFDNETNNIYIEIDPESTLLLMSGYMKI